MGVKATITALILDATAAGRSMLTAANAAAQKVLLSLQNVDNTSDLNKPVSTAQQSALDGKANTSHGHAQSEITNLVTDLANKADLVGGVIPSAQIPAIAITDYLGVVANQTAMLALNGDRGDWCLRSDTGTTWVLNADDSTLLASWTELNYPTAPVTSVNGETGAVTLSAADVGAQPADADLTVIASLTATTDSFMQAKADAWVTRTIAQVKVDLGLAGTNSGDQNLSSYATIAYADSLVVGLLDDRGNYDASVNTFPASGGSGTAGAILKGDLWTVSVAGTLGGTAVTAGDLVRAIVDTPGQTAGNWAVSETNIGYTALNAAMASGTIYVGNGSGVGTAVTISGDVTVSNAGVTAIGALKVTNGMLAGLVAISKLLITGTPDGTKFLRDDSVWQTITSNATHTGEVTGSTTLTVDKTAITNKTLVTAAVGDHVLIADASDTDNLKKVTVQTIVDLASGGAESAKSYLNTAW